MTVNILLLLISISTFLYASRIAFSPDTKAVFFIKLFILTLISFVSLAAFFIRNKKFQDIFDRVRPGKKTVVLLFAAGFVFYLAVSYFLYGKYPHYVVCIDLDSISYFIQAKIFSSGHINVPSHELKDFFATGYLINDGRFFSKYFPGWPFLLSLGVSAKLPWVVNPLFGLLTLIVVYLIGKEVYDRDTAIIASVLLVFSSNFYYLNTSYLSEPSALFFTVLFFYFVVKCIKEPKWPNSICAGISLGITFLIRPYSAVAVALPVMAYYFYISLRDRKAVISFFTIILSLTPAVVALSAYNYAQTGSMFLSTFEYYNPYDKLGFGLRSPDIFMPPTPYTFLDALKNVAMNMGVLSWSGIMFLALFLFPLFVNKKNKWDMVLLLSALSIVMFQMLYHAKSSRYYHVSLFALALLAARGISFSEITFAKLFPGKPVKNLAMFILLFVTAANIFIATAPQKVLQRHKLYDLYRNPFALVKQNKLSNAVVFVRSVPEMYNNTTYYIQNPLDFQSEVLFVKDLGDRNKELMEYYPQKKFYVYEFDRKAKRGSLTMVQ